jgi:parvulin-like peptidyl-prolyl isomerase
MNLRRTASLLTIGSICGIAGCNFGSKPEPLPASAFLSPVPGGSGARRSEMQDQPGTLSYDNPNARRATDPGTLPPLPDISVGSVSDTVRQQVRSPEEDAQRRAATQPGVAAKPPQNEVVQGGFLTVGAVLTSVNGTPIFADKILREIEPILSNRARDLDADRFKALATEEVRKQTQFHVIAELQFAAADHDLDAQDKSLARNLTMQWRQQQVRLAGGSEAQARAKARADGQDFDEQADQQYRTWLRRVYFEKRERPKIEITAEDRRQYYDHNRDAMFAQHDAAFFRVIKISGAKAGGQSAAIAKLTDLKKRVLAGEDFAKLAGTTNDDPILLRGGGAVGDEKEGIQRGSYKLEKLEDAIWKTPPGQITNIVQIGDDYYIAKVEWAKAGHVRPFEDPAVQAEIFSRMEAQQMDQLQQKLYERLKQSAFIYPDPPLFAPALEMAMQQYARWNAK